MGKQQAESRQRAQHGGSFFVESHDGNRAGLRSRERNHPPTPPNQCSRLPRMRCRMRCAHPPRRNHVNHVKLREICHVTTSCDYRERFISAKVIAKAIETTNENQVLEFIKYYRACGRVSGAGVKMFVRT